MKRIINFTGIWKMKRHILPTDRPIKQKTQTHCPPVRCFFVFRDTYWLLSVASTSVLPAFLQPPDRSLPVPSDGCRLLLHSHSVSDAFAPAFLRRQGLSWLSPQDSDSTLPFSGFGKPVSLPIFWRLPGRFPHV